MPEHISITEASRRFGISDRTLRNWVKWGWLEADRVILEGRAHQLLNVDELKAVMKKRGLQEHTGKPEGSGMTLEIAELARDIDDLRDRIFDLENSTRLDVLIEGLESRLEALERHIALAPTLETTDYIARPARAHSAASQKEITAAALGGGSLPPGYVGAESFRHGIPSTTARRWMVANGAQAGEWRDATHHKVTLALPPEVQRAYVAHWRALRPDEFQKCELCPHDLQEQPDQ